MPWHVANVGIMRIEPIEVGNKSVLLRRLLHGALLPGLLLALTAVCFGQTIDPVETIRVDSDLVDLQVSVLSHDVSQPVPLLQQRDFSIFEDGVSQEITFFAAADAPFDLVLLLDLSGSTADKLKLIRRSSKRFVDAARPMDRIAIITFTDTVQIVSPLTSDRRELHRAIDAIEKPMGGTNFWDALEYVLQAVTRREVSRRSAVVVMTDGVDNALPDVFGDGSQTTFETLLNTVKRSTAIVFPIYLDTEKEEVKLHRAPRSAYVLARAQLAQLADASGTVVYRADKLKDLESVYQRVIGDLGTVYSIGYRPKNDSRDGRWHQLSVQLLNHPELTARTRNGYYAKALVPSSPN